MPTLPTVKVVRDNDRGWQIINLSKYEAKPSDYKLYEEPDAVDNMTVWTSGSVTEKEVPVAMTVADVYEALGEKVETDKADVHYDTFTRAQLQVELGYRHAKFKGNASKAALLKQLKDLDD